MKYSKDDLPGVVRKWIKEHDQHFQDWREEAKAHYDMISGDQWDQESKAAMEEMNRPTITFNRAGAFIDAVIGLEVQNRQEVRYLPREIGDIQVNEVLSGAADWALDQCDAEHEDNEVFRDMLICGIGFSETFMSYEIDPDGLIKKERRDPLSMRWDVGAKQRNLSDAKYVVYLRKMQREEAKERWGEEEVGTIDSYPDDLTGIHDATEDWKYKNNQADEPYMSNEVTVAHAQWYEMQKFYRIATIQGVQEVPAKRWDQVKHLYGDIKAVSYMKRVYYQAFTDGENVLGEIEEAPIKDMFNFRALTGKLDRNRNYWYGIARAMRDPQMWSNKFFSSLLQDVSTNGRGIIAEIDAFVNPRSVEDDWADPTKIIMTKSGALSEGKIQPKPAAQYPQGMDRLMAYAVSSFKDVTNINLELLGMNDVQNPGVVESQRKQSSISALSWCFDALSKYRKETGRLLAKFIIQYISDGRLVRIAGQQGEQYVPLLKDKLTFDFDVIVDESPSSANLKDRTWEVVQTLIPTLAQFGIYPPPDFVEYLPLPAKLIESWKAQQAGQTPEAQQVQQLQQEIEQMKSPEYQLEVQEKQVKNQETQSKTMLNQAKTQEIAGEQQLNFQGQQTDNIVKLQQAEKLAAETGNLLAGGK